MVTATEASRSVAVLMDAAEHGECIIVTRGGRRIATIGPAPAANGGAVLALVEVATLDDRFADDVRAAHEDAESQARAVDGEGGSRSWVPLHDLTHGRRPRT